MRFVRRLRRFETRVYAALRSSDAATVATMRPVPFDVGQLAAHQYVLLVTYRRDGSAVPTPVWFGVADGRLYARSDASDGKVRRIRGNAEALIAPCTVLGAPLGPPMAAEARILAAGGAQDSVAEASLRRRYGLGRRLYGVTRAELLDPVYIEIRPR